MPDWKIIEGDCRDVLRSLPASSVHTVVTSPPYFGLRDYGTGEWEGGDPTCDHARAVTHTEPPILVQRSCPCGAIQRDRQIGLEPTPDEFVAALVAVFREVRRVLRDDGTIWVNLGDSYLAQQGAGFNANKRLPERDRNIRVKRPPGIKQKDLVGIPWMVAFALRADGWYLRSDIIWSKPNPMPESVTDRPTKAHEYVFLLSKRATYFYDADAIREDAIHEGRVVKAYGDGAKNGTGGTETNDRRTAAGFTQHDTLVAGRNKRSVWTVATQPLALAHFATFPPKLIEPCILAGAPERACGECGAPWVRVVERGPQPPEPTHRDPAKRLEPGQAGNVGAGNMGFRASRLSGQEMAAWREAHPDRTVGFEPSCSHGDDSARGVVLDPFAGAGTTGMVALQHGRDFVGIELNPEYARMARERIETAVRLGFRAPQKVAVPNGQGSLFD